MKKTLLAIAMATAAVSSVANAAWTSPDGSLTIGGDVEMNFDMVREQKGFDNDSPNAADIKDNETTTQLNDDSRIKLMMEWNTAREDGAFLSAKIEPLIRTDGDVKVDDAYFMFGRKDSWAFQIGRYEAMDLFPLGKDVAVFYADGSDGIGSGVYYYMAKEARGRRDAAGQARVMGFMNNWTAEVSTVYGKAEDVLVSSTSYINNDADTNDGNIESTGNSFIIRPAVNWLSDDGMVSISFGGEYAVNDDSVTFKETVDSEQMSFDLADRYGLSATTTLTFGDLVSNTSIAMQDAENAWKAQTFNTNIIYKDAFGLGVSAAINEFTNKQINYSGTKKDAEDAKSYVVYTAYTMPILGFEDATVTFALSYSETQNAYGVKDRDEETTAFRTRFNYYF